MLRNLLNVCKIFLVFLVISVGSISYSMNSRTKYWFCNQIGTLDGQNVFFASDVFFSRFRNNEIREKAFVNFLKKLTENSFKPEFSSSCFSFDSKSEAVKYIEKYFSIANKRKFEIIKTDFKL